MAAILRASALVSLLVVAVACVPALAQADAPPPSQVLASDPEPPRPAYGLSADGAAIVLGDYAARLDVLVLPALSVGVLVGASHRSATDDLLLEVDLTLWCLGRGLEGPFVTAIVGAAWAGPWNQEASILARVGGEAGWQFLWQSLSIGLGAGAHVALGEAIDPRPEARARVALGIVF